MSDAGEMTLTISAAAVESRIDIIDELADMQARPAMERPNVITSNP
jgi:hypothetical protein